MSDKLVRDLELLAEIFKVGGWSEIRVENDVFNLLLSADPAARALGGAVSTAVPPVAAPRVVMVQDVAPPQSVEAAPATGHGSSGAIDPSWEAVIAPNLGTFYRSPKPGAAPFVEVGQHVEASTEICLIEVMKLFTSVTAGTAGTVRHIAVADAELVEGGQALIYIERD